MGGFLCIRAMVVGFGCLLLLLFLGWFLCSYLLLRLFFFLVFFGSLLVLLFGWFGSLLTIVAHL